MMKMERGLHLSAAPFRGQVSEFNRVKRSVKFIIHSQGKDMNGCSSNSAWDSAISVVWIPSVGIIIVLHPSGVYLDVIYHLVTYLARMPDTQPLCKILS